MSIRYFIYARKSSEGEDRQEASIEDQVVEAQKIAENLGLAVVEVITEAKSAKAPGRVGFNGMLQRIQKGEANGIITWKLNRLARNPVDGGQISWLLQQGVIQHIQTYGGGYRPDDNVMMMQVEFGMANQYVKDLSVDVKRGMRRKAERGWNPSCIMPIGYMHNPLRSSSLNEPEIIPHPDKIRLVKMLWKKMSTGQYSIMEMKRYADRIGLRTPRGNCYSYNTIIRMFQNEFYAGYFLWNNDKGDSVRYKGKHETIINPQTFRLVQNIISGNHPTGRQFEYYFPYRSLMICGKCDGRVTCERKCQVICSHCKNKFSVRTISTCPKCQTNVSDMKNPSRIDQTYYHCNAKNGICNKASVTLTQVESFLREQFQLLQVSEQFRKWSLNHLREENEALEAETEKRRNTTKKKISDLKNRIDRYAQMRADDELGKNEFSRLTKETTSEILALETLLDEMQNSKTNHLNQYINWLEFSEYALTRFEKASPEGRTEILKEIGSNLVLKDKKLAFATPNPIQLLQECYRLWLGDNRLLEPDNDLILYGFEHRWHACFSILLAELRTARTCPNGIFHDKHKPNVQS